MDIRPRCDRRNMSQDRLFYVLDFHVTCELVYNSTDHFKVTQFLCTDIGQKSGQFGVWHRIPLAQITQRRAEFAVRAAVLAHYVFCQRGVRIFDFYGILKLFLIHKHWLFPRPFQVFPRPGFVQPRKLIGGFQVTRIYRAK